MVGLSGMAVAKITSSFMVLTSDGQKHNLGLSIKFDAKSMKVIDYSRKEGRHWEFSDKAIELLREYKVKYPEVIKALYTRTDGKILVFVNGQDSYFAASHAPRFGYLQGRFG